MISINEAVANGITRIRMPHWAIREDYIKLDIIAGKLGPWLHLYSPMNEEINGRNPVSMLFLEFDLDAPVYEIWEVKTGPHWVDKDGVILATPGNRQ